MANRRDWRETFEDPACLSDLVSAARSCMTAADDCPPELCPHAVNRMTPLEFAEWVEDTINARRATRLDHAENRRAGQAVRRSSPPELRIVPA